MKSISDKLMEKIYDKKASFTDCFEPLEVEPFLTNKREYKKKEAEFRELLRRDTELYNAYEALTVNAMDVIDLQYFTLFLEGARTGAKLMLELLEG